MPSKSPVSALTEIRDNIDLARSFAAGLTLAEFTADKKSSYAVIRCLEIISEASRRLPTDLKDRHPSVPWADIAGAGNVYRHDYEDVLPPLIWKTLQESLQSLREVVVGELARQVPDGDSEAIK